MLAALGARVWSLEIVPELALHARKVLEKEGYSTVQVRCADGYAGWREFAPFDVIIATCAPAAVPNELVAQLADGGRMILPVGDDIGSQRLVLVRRHGERLDYEDDLSVRFIPMRHETPVAQDE